MSVTADQHFAIVPEWVLFADVSSHAVRLYCTLRRYADKQGKAHPSRATLAKDMHTSTDTVKRAMAELVEIGALDLAPRYDGQGRQTSNQYLVISHPPVGTGAPLGVGTDAQGEGGTGAPQTIASSELEPEEPEKNSEGFENWWSAYPRKVGKGSARIAYFAALKKTTDTLLLCTAMDYAASARGMESRFVAHPATWLRAERWEDEIATAVAQPDVDYFEAPPVDEERLAAFAAEAAAHPWRKATG